MSIIRVPIDKLASTLDNLYDEFYQDFAAEMTERAVDKAPGKSGNLKGSIRLSSGSPLVTENTPDKNGSTTKQRAQAAKQLLGGTTTAYITAGADYAGAVEFGTDDTRPQPFMRPAALEADNIAKKVSK